MEEFFLYLIKMIGHFGYLGIFLLMAMESTLIPLPSELIMPPAGYLASKNELNIFFTIISGTLGSLAGSYVNYLVSQYLGRPFLYKYGKYVLISERKLKKIEAFFNKHGEISVFTGRLLPVARHLVSIPAGLSKMKHYKFSTYTLLGAGIWVTILTYIGYFIGENEDLLKKYSNKAITGIAAFAIIVIIIYILLQKRREA